MNNFQTMLIVGDSTAQQSASTLMNMIKVGKGGCEGSIRMGLSDTLVGRSDFGALNRGPLWIDYVNEWDPDIVGTKQRAFLSLFLSFLL
jgi:hypothetical protein